MDYPRLRPLEVLPVQHDSQPMVLLRDPLGYSDAVLLLPPAAYFIVSHFDGSRSVRDVQTAFVRRFRQLILSDQIQEMVRQLDDALFLDNERFQLHRRSAEEAFRARAVRPASLVGQSYPEDAAQLAAWLDSFCEPPQESGQQRPGSADRLSALIVPHIDFQRGGYAYARAYRQIAEAGPADLYVLLGTGHAARERFVLTRKDFATPFGVLSTAQDVVRELVDRLSWDPFQDEWVHKSEHSLEFQVLWLAHLLGVRDYEILPILFGSFEDLLGAEGLPEERDDRIARFCEALREVLECSGRRVCLIASVDFAHVGTRFGDLRPVTPILLRRLEREDREALQHLVEQDAAGFYRHLARDLNRRRLDGLSTLYVMLRVLPPVYGEVLCYDQAVDLQENSVVSFASVAYRLREREGASQG